MRQPVLHHHGEQDGRFIEWSGAIWNHTRPLHQVAGCDRHTLSLYTFFWLVIQEGKQQSGSVLLVFINETAFVAWKNSVFSAASFVRHRLRLWSRLVWFRHFRFGSESALDPHSIHLSIGRPVGLLQTISIHHRPSARCSLEVIGEWKINSINPPRYVVAPKTEPPRLPMVLMVAIPIHTRSAPRAATP